jgi:hypothetical protein
MEMIKIIDETMAFFPLGAWLRAHEPTARFLGESLSQDWPNLIWEDILSTARLMDLMVKFERPQKYQRHTRT